MLLGRGRSFAGKLVLLATLTSGLAVVMVTATFRIMELVELKRAALDDAVYLARTIASSSTASLSFNDKDAAREKLSYSGTNPYTLAAYIYKDGELFAGFERPDRGVAPLGDEPLPGYRFEGQRLYLAHTVAEGDGPPLGTLLIVYDLRAMYRHVYRNILLAFLVGGAAMLASFLLALRLQRVLARPVAELAATAQKVSETQDYSLRAKPYSDDELGRLTAAFNQMLETIQARDTELEDAQDALAHSEERSRKIVDTALDAVVTMDANGMITGWNAQAEKTFGWLATEAIGKKMDQLIIPEAYREMHRAGLQRYLQTGESRVLNRRLEITGLRRGGVEFPVELAITPIRLDETVQFSAFIQDISQRKRAEEARAHFMAIVGSSDDAIISKDLNGIIRSWNPGAERMFGYTAAEAIGKPVTMLIPPHQVDEEQDILGRIKRGERIEHFDTKRLRKDGRVIDVSLAISPLYDTEGRIVGASKIARDITAHKRAEAELARERALLRALVENVPDCIYIKDDQCRFLMNNPAHLRALGAASQEDTLGKTDADFFPKSLAMRYRADDERVLRTAQPLLHREEPVVDASGRRLWMIASKVPLCDAQGRATGLIGISRDITDLRDAMQRLETVNRELRQKNQEMEQFVYTVSHDLKSPIVTVVGFLGLMREDIKSGRYDDLHDSMERLERAAGRMHQSIEDLLELSRIGRIRNEPVQIDMDELMQQLAEDMAPRLKEAGITLRINGPLPQVIGDRTRVTEVFENLITNAIKYGSDVPDPRIEIGSEPADEENRFYVRDNGPGIPPEYHKRIFGLFQRLNNKKEGTGVGLTIVSRIMEVHGGRAWVESEPGQGATFWVAFPLAVFDPSEQVAAAQPAPVAE